MFKPDQPIWGTDLRSNALSVASQRASDSVKFALHKEAREVFHDLFANPAALNGPPIHAVPKHATRIARTIREASEPIIEIVNGLNPDHPKTLIDPAALEQAQTEFYVSGVNKSEDIAMRRHSAHRLLRNHVGGWIQLALASRVRSLADLKTDVTSQLIYSSTGDYLIYGGVATIPTNRAPQRLQPSTGSV